MIDALKPYPKMKDSGVEWLGMVPEHWEVVPLCSVAKTKSISGKNNRELLSVYLGLGVVRFSDVQEKRTNVTSEDISKYQAVDPGDFVLNNQQAWRGSVGVSKYTGIVSPAYLVLSLNSHIDSDFANKLFRDQSMVSQYLVASKGVGTIQRNLYWPHLRRASTLLPPLPEQTAIVRYLDYMDRRIRRLIRAKRKLITLLNEQKQVIIHHAVTRGLDPNVPLKDSGVEWLGMVPEHWEVKKIKDQMFFCGGGTPSKAEPSYWKGDIPWVSPKDMKCDILLDTEEHITEQAIVESSTNLVPSGSILIVVRSGILQRTIPIVLCARQVALNQDMKALLPKKNLNKKYFVSLVRGNENIFLTLWTKQGATVESIEHQYLANTLIPIPPVQEQTAIVEYLDQVTANIDTAITRARREIDLLTEYRTRLIADVVTGKVDVREVAARLPDETNETESPDLADGIGDEGEMPEEKFSEVGEELEA